MLPEFHGIVPELMLKFGIGRLVFGGGSLGGGVGGVLAPGGGGRALGGGWPCVLCVVYDVLFCILTKCFFRVFALFLFSLLSAAVSSGEFFLSACSLASLASCRFFWSGLLCTAQFRFSQLMTCSKNLTFYRGML